MTTTSPAAPTTPEALREAMQAFKHACFGYAQDPTNHTERRMNQAQRDLEAALAAPAEGQKPAEPPGQESGGSGSERAACRYPACSQGTDPACDGPCTPAPAQEGRQSVVREVLHFSVKSDGETYLIGCDEEPGFCVASQDLWKALADIAPSLRKLQELDGKMPAATASAPSADLSAAIRALPLPEPVSMVASSADGFFSREQVRALLESAASLVRATPPDLAAELPDPNAKCDLGTLQGALMNNQPLNVNQRSALYAMAAELRECREDAERLNWLQESRETVFLVSHNEWQPLSTDGGDPRVKVQVFDGWAVDDADNPSQTIREAIDKARALRAKGGAA